MVKYMCFIKREDYGWLVLFAVFLMWFASDQNYWSLLIDWIGGLIGSDTLIGRSRGRSVWWKARLCWTELTIVIHFGNAPPPIDPQWWAGTFPGVGIQVFEKRRQVCCNIMIGEAISGGKCSRRKTERDKDTKGALAVWINPTYVVMVISCTEKCDCIILQKKQGWTCVIDCQYSAIDEWDILW